MKNKKKWFILIMLGLILTIFLIQYNTIDEDRFEVNRVAHAGGGINGKTYTNSLDALDLSIDKGFIYFELDFIFTKDRHLVCLHDWEGSFSNLFGFKIKERLDLGTFNQLVKNTSEFEQCSLDTLILWMERTPEAVIITDVKEDNLLALQIISQKVPDFKKRIIPQIYDPVNYHIVKEMGYGQIIWTLYRYSGSNEDALREVDNFSGCFAVTMDKKRAKSDFPTKLKQKNIQTYVHTVNDIEEKNEFINNFNLTEIYTDFLVPE